MKTDRWPALPLEGWQDTYATLHMWTQVVGKIRLALTPLVNHYWNVPLYVTSRGLTTSPMPHGDLTLAIDFDFIDHVLRITCDDGRTETVALAPKSVAAFYAEVMSALGRLGARVDIWTMPVEGDNPIPFEKDTLHATYDRDSAHRCWRILVESRNVMERFRAEFLGKCSPVHFFWGSFDLAVTRFSGRQAPAREGADPITREAYSHEVISHGFWPGARRESPASDGPDDGKVHEPAFYAYAAPVPEGLEAASVRPAAAAYNATLGEFVLPYEAVRTSADPEAMLLDFFRSTYDAAASLAAWDRASLERRDATR